MINIDTIIEDLIAQESGLDQPQYADRCPDAWANALAQVHAAVMKPTENGEAMPEKEEAEFDRIVSNAAEDVLNALQGE